MNENIKDIIKYKQLFKTNLWIDISDAEINQIINNVDSIGNLLFSKYLIKVKDYEK